MLRTPTRLNKVMYWIFHRWFVLPEQATHTPLLVQPGVNQRNVRIRLRSRAVRQTLPKNFET